MVAAVDPFEPVSDGAKALAAKAERENAELIEARKTATAAEKKNLSGLRGVADGRSSPYRLNPFKIKVTPGFNARMFDTPDAADDDAELVASIKAKGVLHSLTIRMDQDGLTPCLVDGERRLRCVIRAINEGAPVLNVPVSAAPAGMDEADLLASQLTHNMGRRYTLLELGAVVRRLLAFGWDHVKIEAETATPISRQKAALETAALPVEAKAMIRSGTVSAKMAAKTIAAAPSQDEGVQQLKEAAEVAKGKGRTRAMPKDLPGKTMPPRRPVFVDKSPAEKASDEKRLLTALKEIADHPTEGEEDAGDMALIARTAINAFEGVGS